MKRTSVLITASREWTNRAVMFDRLKRYPKGTILIHGGARGGDRIAASIGRSLGFIIHEYPYFGDLEKRGGHVRNDCMLHVLIDHRNFGFDIYVEAFPTPESKGTRDMIDIVRKINAPSAVKPIPLNVEEG